MPIYSIFSDTPEDVNYEAKPLDGDFSKVVPTGFSFHPVANATRAPDGDLLFGRFDYQGYPVDIQYLPTKVMLGGPKRNLTDLLKSHGIFLFSEKLRTVVEELEEKKHQFSPVGLVWKDNSHAANFFWFYPGTRVDGMDPDRTSFLRSDKTKLWKVSGSGQFFANLSQIGSRNIWVDSSLPSFDCPFVSQKFHDAAKDAGVRGIGYHTISCMDE